KGLHGMERVGESVDDGHRRPLSEKFELCLGIRANHHCVDVAGKDPRGVLDRFAAGKLHLLSVEVEARTAQLADSHIKGDSRPCRRLEKDHSDRLSLQTPTEAPLAPLALELCGKVEKSRNQLRTTVG